MRFGPASADTSSASFRPVFIPLLEGMEYINGALKFDRVNCSVGVSAMVFDYFEDATIGSLPANSHDSAFCLLLWHSPVHAGMSGRTNMVVSFWTSSHMYLSRWPHHSEKEIDPEGALWNSVLVSTG